MRATLHNGRKGRNGVFSANHNDRKFSTYSGAEAQNEYWCCYPGMNFSDAERKFYDEHFGKSLALQNEKYRAARQYGRIKSIDDYLTSPLKCPEEEILCFGNISQGASVSQLSLALKTYLKWHQSQFPSIKILNWAIHTDEAGVCHVHVRKVYIGHDKNGNEVISENKALREMGLGANKKPSRYDNPKIEYTRVCRSNWEALGRGLGLEIETERKARGEVGLTLTEYKARQIERNLVDREQTVAQKEAQLMQQEQALSAEAADLSRQRQNLIAKSQGLAEMNVNFQNNVERVRAEGYRAGYAAALENTNQLKR